MMSRVGVLELCARRNMDRGEGVVQICDWTWFCVGYQENCGRLGVGADALVYGFCFADVEIKCTNPT
jgi:hypothetical protein